MVAAHLNIRSLSRDSFDGKQLTAPHLDISNEDEESNRGLEDEEISLGTESITLTTDDEHDKEDTEVIRLQYDEDQGQDEYFVPGLDDEEGIPGELTRPGYKRMNLKGESESDKDLIIYSLNESLQIHKEMVERVQTEKDDIEYQYELEKAEETKEIEQEKDKVNSEQKESMEKMNKLESMYQALLNELESKKLEYHRMESRFHSYVKDIKSNDDDIYTIQSQINELFNKVSHLCKPLSTAATSTTLDYFFERWPDMMGLYFETEELESSTISLLTEKMLVETIMHDIFQTPIHPGITLNHAFGKIHSWVNKRNSSWAARIRQQIFAFLVKQSNEEDEAIEAQKQAMIHDVWEKLCLIYNVTVESKKQDILVQWTDIINDAFKLNVAIKCQDRPPIEIRQIREGSLFDGSLMKTYSEGDTVAFIVSPPFTTGDEYEGFLIHAKVYCV